MKMKKPGMSILVAVVILSASAATSFAVPVWSDDFEDGVVDPALWVAHGYKGGIGGVGAGSWEHSETEQAGPDGYFAARVWGPTSGNTYGAEAWIRTVKDFNDGDEWLINFTWSTSASDYHVDNFAVQIADGSNTDTLNWHQYADDSVGSGWVNLWQSGSGDIAQPTPPFSKQTWSVKIDPGGTASLYTTINAQGSPYEQMTLEMTKEWHLRFLLNDATSSGFPAGDNAFRLYDFAAVPDPATLSLLLLGGVVALKRRR